MVLSEISLSCEPVLGLVMYIEFHMLRVGNHQSRSDTANCQPL